MFPGEATDPLETWNQVTSDPFVPTEPEPKETTEPKEPGNQVTTETSVTHGNSETKETQGTRKPSIPKNPPEETKAQNN